MVNVPAGTGSIPGGGSAFATGAGLGAGTALADADGAAARAVGFGGAARCFFFGAFLAIGPGAAGSG